jgi:hypothetical protein
MNNDAHQYLTRMNIIWEERWARREAAQGNESIGEGHETLEETVEDDGDDTEDEDETLEVSDQILQCLTQNDNLHRVVPSTNMTS